MSGPSYAPQPTPELLNMMLKLGQNKDFVAYMAFLDQRCTSIALHAHQVAEEPYRMWASGRVQELSGLLYLFHQRNELLKMMPKTEPGGFTSGGDE